jgi:hypothetical protein
MIFEENHLKKIIIFVFDQSSAYASYGKSTLNVFMINTSESNALASQKNIYYPPEYTKKYLISTP